MATYAIGDIQGCYDEFCDLLAAIHFKAEVDQLWCVGDLVNRGNKSLDVLRFLSAMPRAPIIVLGNHDFHLLAVINGAQKIKKEDTFQDVLEAEDGAALANWLAQQKLIHHDPELGFTMSHAGIPPFWTLEQARTYASEVESLLRSGPSSSFYKHLYGDHPDRWSEQLQGMDRIRFIVNAFTRMRLCYLDGRLDFSEKGKPKQNQQDKLPWFLIPRSEDLKILFGHWAALEGKVDVNHIYALDTGCVWGGRLTALRLEDQTWTSVPAKSSIGI